MKKNVIFFALLASAMLTVSCEKQNAVPQKSSKSVGNTRMNAVAPIIVPLEGGINGHTYKNLLEETYKWTLSNPMNMDPWADIDGSFHAANQPLSDIMILVSNSGGETERSITIPAGKYAYFPVLGVMAWDFYGDPGCTRSNVSNVKAQQRLLGAYGRRFNNGAKNLIATIDGQPLVADFSKFRVKTDPFKAYLHPDYNIYNSIPCTPISQIVDANADFYALLVKLPQGHHTVHLAGDMLGGPLFHSGITWHLNVE